MGVKLSAVFRKRKTKIGGGTKKTRSSVKRSATGKRSRRLRHRSMRRVITHAGYIPSFLDRPVVTKPAAPRIIKRRVAFKESALISALRIGLRGKSIITRDGKIIARPQAKIIKRVYSFAGRQRSTKLRYFMRNDMDRKYSAFYKTAVGRSSTGSCTVYTKGAASKRLFVNYIKSLVGARLFAMPLKCFRDPRGYKTAVVFTAASGATFTLPLTNRTLFGRVLLGGYTHQYVSLFEQAHRIRRLRLCEYAGLIHLNRTICYIAARLGERVTIAKAPGSRATIIKRAVRKNNKRVVIKMPSGSKKVISADTITLLGYILPKRRKRFKNSRAGFWRLLGHKPTVRGIVKNPVDHPHGGRTKTVLWQRSPWGKSTK